MTIWPLKVVFSQPCLSTWPCSPLPASYGNDDFLCTLTSQAKSTQLRQGSQLTLWTLGGIFKGTAEPELNNELSI